jgi:hypothetical protein
MSCTPRLRKLWTLYGHKNDIPPFLRFRIVKVINHEQHDPALTSICATGCTFPEESLNISERDHG